MTQMNPPWRNSRIWRSNH